MSYKLEYKLLQQSPIIHFQSEQSGATLRATEVKPKLDKYIIYTMGGRQSVDNSWFIADHDALNYKISFTASVAPQISIGRDTDYDIYFGNQGNDQHKYALTSNNISVIVTSFIPSLLTKIDEVIGDFFILFNFGTMQDKGFGSYIVEGKNSSPSHISETLRNYYHASACYSFDSGETPFRRIKTVYSIIKSGVNDNRGYQRSLLFLYMHNRYHICNEKAALKQNGVAPITGNHQHDTGNANETQKYVRALLGVGDTLRFKNENLNGVTSVNIRSNVIERLSSPILFKIINEKVYYVGRRIDNNIYGKTFKFTGRGKIDLNVPTNNELGEHFIDEFLEFCYNAFNNSLDYQGIGANVSQNILNNLGDNFTVRRV